MTVEQREKLLFHSWIYLSEEYLLLKPFIVMTNNNLLTYIMTTPNLDATRHQWLESLAWFIFSIKYQKGCDNVAANTLSWITLKLNAETMKSILNGVSVGTTNRADAHDPVVAKADEEIHQPVQETMILAWAAHIDLHVSDYMNWLTGGSSTQDCNQVDLWLEKTGSKTPAGRQCKYWRR